VTIGQKVAISINITNNAPTVQTFTVRAKWGAITVVEQDMTLNPGERKDVALSWDTSNYSPGTANVTIVIPQSGSVQNGGPLTLNPPPSSFLSNSLLLILGAGVGVAIVVAATIIWLIRRGRTVAGTPLPSSQKGALGLSQLERIHLTSPRKTVLQKSAALIFAQWSRLKVLVGFV